MHKPALYCLLLPFRRTPAIVALVPHAATAAALVVAVVASASAGDRDLALDPEEIAFQVILSKEELREYEATSIDRHAAFQERFWRENDPDPTTASNERFEEHVQRIAKCRELFGGGAPLRWDDRCEALVRYGLPLVRVADGGEVHAQGRWEPPRERWLYREVFLYMEDRNLDGRYEFGISSQASNIGGMDHISEDDGFIRDYANDSENPILDFEGRPEVEVFFTDFSPQKLIKMLDEGREAWVKEPRVYESARTGKEIPFFFDVTTFRADAEESTAASRSELVVNYLIPYEPLTRDDRGVWIERRTVVLDGERTAVNNSIESIEQGPPRGDADAQWILNSTSFVVPPGSYQLASRVVDLISPEREMGLSRTDAVVPEYGGGALAMSDVLFGMAIEPVGGAKAQPDSGPGAGPGTGADDAEPRAPGVMRHGWRIVPMPVRRFDARTQPHIYFEIYNLTAAAPGEYKYRVEYVLTKREARGFVASIRGLFQGTMTPGVAVAFEREAHVPDAENWIAIDTSELPPDTYFLETRVKDLVGGGETSRRASFVMAGKSK
jgi:GWxTD domain-containing protein